MASPQKVIQLRPTGEPRRLNRPDGFVVAAVAVGVDGEAIRLLVPDEHSAALVPKEGSSWPYFPKEHNESTDSSIVAISRGPKSRQLRLLGLVGIFSELSMFPNGEILVVAPRCRPRSDGSELNAQVFDQDGKRKRAFLLGDGINRVQCDRQGNIWVAYFDEGVFGNLGWGDDINPLGASGLSCFTGDGHRTWDFKPPGRLRRDMDCYALNVSGAGAWAYYYDDFPIVFIDSNWQIRAWKTQTSGARTFAVGDQNILLYGGYEPERTWCRLLRVGDGVAELIGRVALDFPDKVDLTKAKVIGRGKELHVFSGDDWYRFSVDSVG